MSAQVIADTLSASDEVETVFKICKRLSANPESGVTEIPGADPGLTGFQAA